MSNHSGGLFTMDVAALTVAFYDRFGYDRPIYTLGHDRLLIGPAGSLLNVSALSGPIRSTLQRRSAAIASW